MIYCQSGLKIVGETTDQHPTKDCYKKCAYVGNNTSATSANIHVITSKQELSITLFKL